jgi:ABC-type multidrug transport system fused ATPase/permease subunit
MMSAFVSSQRFFAALDTKPITVTRDQGNKLVATNGQVLFQDVSFKYPNGTSALSNLSLEFAAGKRTALVGHSGSGKSTIFNLLLKFYDATSGKILIDGQNIADASINSVRSSISLVSQDIFIFDDTAYNNIAYGKDGATEEEVVAAAKAAKCHDFIMAMPDGYKTNLGFFGQNLSGGQKQRIAIARAFLRNSPILLLDEATSALDTETEAEIQASIDNLSQNRTTIIIAHRLSAVVKADNIIMLRGGQLVAQGSHTQLQDHDDYSKLFGL